MTRRTAERAASAATVGTTKARSKAKEETGSAKAAQPRRVRVKPEERYKEFVAKAIELFSEVGFDAGTRELAQRLNVTQPLLYRYFPSKEKLIAAVYKEIYLDRWKPSWTETLNSHDRPLPERLQAFYEDYTDTIFTPEWLRIYLFAGLRGVDINARYVANVETSILEPIAREVRQLIGLSAEGSVRPEEVELFWTLHGGIFYYGVRKVVYGFDCAIGKPQMIANAIAAFLEGAQSVIRTLEDERQAEAKAKTKASRARKSPPKGSKGKD